MKPRRSIFLALTGLIILTSPLIGQMSKRRAFNYKEQQFLKLTPTIGEALPDLLFEDIDGNTHALLDLIGKTVVLIGGGYT